MIRKGVLSLLCLIVPSMISCGGGSSGSNSTIQPTKTTPSVTFPAPAGITYGTALSVTQQTATASTSGSFAYTPVIGTVLAAGTQTLSVQFTPNELTDYNIPAAVTTTIVVAKATPVVTWTNPAGITYGTALSGTQLNATASTAGTFSYSPAAGATLGAGSQTLSVAFVPTDTANYNSPVTATATIVIAKATPVVTWAPSLTGFNNTTPLTSAQLDATANTAGTFVYTPAAGTVLGAGSKTLSAAFTPTDTANYNSPVTATATIVVPLRTITVGQTSGTFWVPNCSSLFSFTATQTGVIAGDTLNLSPYRPATFTTAPASSFPLVMGLSDTGGANICSPGPYALQVTGQDGAASNTVYLPVTHKQNLWGGYNATDEFVADTTAGVVRKYKLSDGTPDGTIGTSIRFAIAVDGNNVLVSGLGNLGINVYNATTGVLIGGPGVSSGIPNITDIASANGIGVFTQATAQTVSFFDESVFASTVLNIGSVGVAPSSVTATTGCLANTTTASIYDNTTGMVSRVDATKVSGGTISAVKNGSVILGGFSPASSIRSTLARYIVGWNTNCRVGVLAPVSLGTNPDGSVNYNMQFALVDETGGTLRQLGTYLTNTNIVANSVHMVAD